MSVTPRASQVPIVPKPPAPHTPQPPRIPASPAPHAPRPPRTPAPPAPHAPWPLHVPAPPVHPSFARVQEVLARLDLPAAGMVLPRAWCMANAPGSLLAWLVFHLLNVLQCDYCAQKRRLCVFPAVEVWSRQGGATCEACYDRHGRCLFCLLWSAWLAAHEEGWSLAGVYEALGGWRGVDEVVEEASDPETTEEDELEDEGGVEGGDVQGGGEEVQVVTKEVRGMGMGRKSRVGHIVMSGSKDEGEDEDKSAAGPSVVALGKRRARDDSKDEDESGPSKRPRSDSGRGWIRRHRKLLDGVAGARLFILDGLRQVQPRYRLPPQVPEGMRVLKDMEETHHCLSFASWRTLEHVATNLGEDILGLELAVQEQWQDMVRSLGVIKAEKVAAMDVDLTEAPEGLGEIVDMRTGEAVREGSSGGGMGMDLDN
ncbi:hypothetical protein C0992_013298 [Termitomyces sp. T32_za158]|nr:hypothetical protein C0992_013298 [Termitomyces sp. T32_za158]